MLKITDLFVVS